MTIDRDRLIRQLERDEGFVPHAYQDSLGYWTIGIGRLIDERKGGKISLAEAHYLLANDIERTINQLDLRLPAWNTLDPVRKEVLVNLAFNLGVMGLLGFKNTLAHVFAGRYAEAAAGMLKSKWAEQVGIGTTDEPGRALRLARAMKNGQFTT